MTVEAAWLKDLAAKQAITEVIHRYCRGMDRMDKALTLSCWHPDGTDDHAPLYAGSAEGFIEWLWPIHAAMVSTRHVVTNILIALDGDRATAETYWSLTLRVEDGGALKDIVAGGRYLDRFECIGGVWAIRSRIAVGDLDRVDPVAGRLTDAAGALLAHAQALDAAPKIVARDRTDLSYSFLGGE